MLSEAVIVDKHDASTVISILKKSSAINEELKIKQEKDLVYIPISSKHELNIIENISYTIEQSEFESKSTRPASLKEALSLLLPDINEDKYQTSYDQIGDIAVIDLNDDLIPYQEQVGEAILWSNPAMNAVFRKSHKVDGLHRLRGLHHIAGDNHTKTIHKEHGLRIVVDIEKAYFSPRLATEHARIASKIPEGSYVLDMFGSLAPFALHLTKNKNITVDTVDINPNVPDLIEESIEKNSLTGKINVFQEDVRSFVKKFESAKYDYVLMNHPSEAYDYLPEALSITKSGGRLFYYDFVEIDTYSSIIKDKLSLYEEFRIEDIHIVRQSSPYEYHVAVELIVE